MADDNTETEQAAVFELSRQNNRHQRYKILLKDFWIAGDFGKTSLIGIQFHGGKFLQVLPISFGFVRTAAKETNQLLIERTK